MSTEIYLPAILRIGADASLALVDVMRTLGCKEPLLITDKVMVELGYVQKIERQLGASGIRYDCFTDTVPEPTTASIQAGVEKARSGNYDCLVALGGGSPIDSAKAISILAFFGGEMRDYKFPHIIEKQGLPVIAIPTTAGTGSEATRVMVITEESNKAQSSLLNDEKMMCIGPGLMPAAALVDYKMSMTVPPRTTADTGIDSLTHAIEAYVSKKANPFSDAQALHSMRLIGPNIRKVFHDGTQQAPREAMMLGATLGGIAFSNASVGLVHGMSRPIGAHFHVPHGLSNAMLLPVVTEFSIPGAPERYAECAHEIGIAQRTDDTLTATNNLIKELRALNSELQVPTPGAFGISKSAYMNNLEVMAEQALASGSPANNPRQASKDEIVSLYQSAWVD